MPVTSVPNPKTPEELAAEEEARLAAEEAAKKAAEEAEKASATGPGNDVSKPAKPTTGGK